MKKLYTTLRNSIYNPGFYQGVSEAPLSTAARYYVQWSLILAAVLAIVLGIFVGTAGSTFIKKYAPGIVSNYYPKELTIHIEKGEASANVTSPYFVPVRSLSGATTTLGTVQNLLVIDTTHSFDPKTFDTYKTYALLTKTDLVTTDNNGQITIQSLRRAPTVTISQELLLSWVEQIRAHLPAIIIAGTVAMFVVFLVGYLLYFAVLLLFALVPLLVAWIKKTPLSYSGAYKMSLYAIVPALVLKTILNMFGLFFLPAYLTLLVFLLVITLNMREGEQQSLFQK